MTLQAELPGLARASRRIDTLHDELREEHATLRRQIDDLLDTHWTGEAAGLFHAVWTQWCRGLADVLAGLDLERAAIELTRAELVGTDQERAAAARLLHERLGGAS